MPRSPTPVKPPPLAEQRGATMVRLVEVMRRLLAPDGCPWDREQSYQSLRRYVLEEACEVIDAIDDGGPDALCEELGDLLLQVVFLAELGRRDGDFGPDDVVARIVDKLIRRHPHVFGDATARDAGEVVERWERIKARERADKGDRRGVLGGVPVSLPALVRAERVSQKAAEVGFDWPDPSGPRAKIDEELAELDHAVASGSPERQQQELGDVLFAVVNLARHRGLDADQALRGCVARFADRFGHVERQVDERHGGFAKGPVPLETLETYWAEAKARR